MSQAALAELAALSARLGRDPLRVQAAGGNTSIKLDDTLWIKASGQWLAEAEARDIMVPVALGPMRAAFAAGEDIENAARFMPAPSALRPSIETAMHAILPRRVVLHVHCVATIAVAVRRDAYAVLATALRGLNWALIPYARPGQPLAAALATRPGADIYVLGNHGLTVAADTIAAAASLLDAVAARLEAPPLPAPSSDRPALATLDSAWEPAASDIEHALATDPARFAIVRAGSLYPDHVIFLGRGVAEWPAAAAPMALVPGRGMLLRRDASASARAMARCLADVAARIPPGVPVVTLTSEDEAALLGWEAETYRQALTR